MDAPDDPLRLLITHVVERDPLLGEALASMNEHRSAFRAGGGVFDLELDRLELMLAQALRGYAADPLLREGAVSALAACVEAYITRSGRGS